MHALFPPMNDILRGTQRQPAVARRGVSEGDSQVGVDPRDMCSGHLRREGVQPALGLPLVRVVAPERLAGVAAEHAHHHLRALRDGDLVQPRAVGAVDGLRERDDGVFGSATHGVIRCAETTCDTRAIRLTCGSATRREGSYA